MNLCKLEVKCEHLNLNVSSPSGIYRTFAWVVIHVMRPYSYQCPGTTTWAALERWVDRVN